jgi:hypothetical protein
MQEGLHIAAALQRLLALVHRSRDIHRQHQLEIDRRVVGGCGRGQGGSDDESRRRRPPLDRTQRHRQTHLKLDPPLDDRTSLTVSR